MIPNVLRVALSAVPRQRVCLRRFQSRAQNPRGQWVSTYEADEAIVGAWQPVDAATAKAQGLDTSRRNWRLWTAHDVKNVNRGAAPDIVVVGDRRHEVMSCTDWLGVNGWRELLCVEVGDEPEGP